jgi:hypothetical protein
MATTEQLEMLAGKALLDQKFLHDLITDPQYAANQAGISLDPDQVARLAQFQSKEEELTQVLEQLRDMRQGFEEIIPQPVAAVAW